MAAAGCAASLVPMANLTALPAGERLVLVG